MLLANRTDLQKRCLKERPLRGVGHASLATRLREALHADGGLDLGADAVAVGRPDLRGLAAFGQAGVE